jgi:hypothetical protein
MSVPSSGRKRVQMLADTLDLINSGEFVSEHQKDILDNFCRNSELLEQNSDENTDDREDDTGTPAKKSKKLR